ncbi:hypothetical protein ElyMa_005379500, partial [Elysia marginata]
MFPMLGCSSILGECILLLLECGRTLSAGFPGVLNYCIPSLVDGYFQGNSSRCICNTTSDGYPRGAARWYNGHQQVGTDGVLDIAYDKNGPVQVYTCEAVSGLGRKVVSTLTAKFP